MNGYFLNDVFIKTPQNALISNFYSNYLFKNRLNPKKSSYKVEDNLVTLLYNDIAYEFPTLQNSSLIDYYNTRYTDLYSCCFNTSNLKVFLPNTTFKLPNGLIQPFDNSLSYQVYNVANPNINCTGIVDNECVFFYRWYCLALRDLVGYENMSKYDSNCNCYKFKPENRVFIKMGTPVNCYDQSCSNTAIAADKSITTELCQTTVCSNMLVIKDILAGENINISNLSLNLSCS